MAGLWEEVTRGIYTGQIRGSESFIQDTDRQTDSEFYQSTNLQTYILHSNPNYYNHDSGYSNTRQERSSSARSRIRTHGKSNSSPDFL